MSGLFGIVDTRNKLDIQTYLREAQSTLSHFAWYTTQSWVHPGMPLGLGYVGIGILNREPQPTIDSIGKTFLFMAGELYHTAALIERLEKAGFTPRSTAHSELALSAFQAFGNDFARYLDGVFIIAIFDEVKRRLIITNDRLGQYPTYYAIERGRLVFAPEVKGILCAPFIQRKLNITAAAQYFRFQHLLETNTFHEGISQFPYASVAEFHLDSGDWKVHRYWDWDDIQPRLDMTFDEAVEEGSRVFRQAIRERSSDSLRPGVFLTGGLDSRTIVGFLSQYRSSPVTATFGVKDSRDVHYAAQIARAVGSRHYWFDLPDGRWVARQAEMHLNLTEGFHSWVHMHGISMLPQLRDVMDYNLSGWDGGTVMGHKDHVRPEFNHPVDQTQQLAILYDEFTKGYTWPGLTEAEERSLYSPSFRKQAIGLAFDSMAQAFQPYTKFREDNRSEYFYIRNHCFRLTQNMITFSRSHLEARFPFWDYQLLEFMYGLKPEIRGHQILYRAIITRELPRLAVIPYDKQEFLPTIHPLQNLLHAMSVRVRRRLRVFPSRTTLYADYENYLRYDLREWAEDILFDPRTEKRGIWNMETVRSLFQRHMSGHEQWTIGKIAPLITFEMMMRKFFD